MAPKHKKTPLRIASPRQDNSFREEVSLTCACNRDITLAELGKVYIAREKGRLEKFLPHLNSTFNKYAITSCIRKAHFLAQVGHETGQLELLAEQLEKGVQEKDVYDGYKGRGLIQITYKNGYVSYGKYVGRDFTNENKADLEDVCWATDSAGWYWAIRKSPSLNGFADKNDLIYITQSINGAYNGYQDRLAILNRSALALLIHQCPNLSSCPNMSNFHLDHSEAFNIPAAAFAWGLWHDPQSPQHGTSKDEKEALMGYKKFLELKQAQTRGRFGFKTPAAMVRHAEKRISEVDKGHE